MSDQDDRFRLGFVAFAAQSLPRRCWRALGWFATLLLIVGVASSPFVDWKNDAINGRWGRTSFSTSMAWITAGLGGTAVLLAACAPMVRTPRRGSLYGVIVAAPIAFLYAYPLREGAQDVIWWLQTTIPSLCLLAVGASFGHWLGAAPLTAPQTRP